MKIIFILIILFINALFWSFISMGGSSRHEGEGSSSKRQAQQKYENKIKNNLEYLKEKNKCTGKEDKVIYPSQEAQKELIKLYWDNNERFRDALEMAKNPNGERFFDRFASEEYKVNGG